MAKLDMRASSGPVQERLGPAAPPGERFLTGDTLVFAGSMCIRRFKGRFVTRRERVATGSRWPARKNILGEAQAFADLMGISRYRGSMCLSVSRVENGQTDSADGGVPLGVATIFTALMAIGRYREESSQCPTTGTREAGSQPNGEHFSRGNYFHRLVFIKGSTKPRTNQRATPKPHRSTLIQN